MNNLQVGGNINAGGNIIVGNDNSTHSKLWINCSNDELREDFKYRKKLLRDETLGKWKRFANFWLIIGVAVGIISIYFYFSGNANLSGLLMGGAGILCALSGFKFAEKPNEFELRQMEAINEIKMLLKERGEKV